MSSSKKPVDLPPDNVESHDSEITPEEDSDLVTNLEDLAISEEEPTKLQDRNSKIKFASESSLEDYLNFDIEVDNYGIQWALLEGDEPDETKYLAIGMTVFFGVVPSRQHLITVWNEAMIRATMVSKEISRRDAEILVKSIHEGEADIGQDLELANGFSVFFTVAGERYFFRFYMNEALKWTREWAEDQDERMWEFEDFLDSDEQ
jgi:hypothetical protein